MKKSTRKRHRWIGSLVKFGLGTCKHCGTVREVVTSFGKRRQFYIRTYVQPDGIRHTGWAPRCTEVIG